MSSIEIEVEIEMSSLILVGITESQKHRCWVAVLNLSLFFFFTKKGSKDKVIIKKF